MGIKNSSGSNFSLPTSNESRRNQARSWHLRGLGSFASIIPRAAAAPPTANLMCRRVYRLMKLTTRGLAHLVGQLLATARQTVRQQSAAAKEAK